MGSYKNQWFAKYGHECEIGSAKGEQLPMFQLGGNVTMQIKNMLTRAKMASEVNIRGNNFLRSQKAVDNEHFNHLKHPYILHPFSTMRKYWEVVMMFTYLVIFVTMPLDIASYNFPLQKHLNNNIAWKVFRNIFDLVCLIDVAINFFTGYVNVKGKVIVMEPTKIAIRYAMTFFLPDILSSIPTHLDLFIGRRYLDYMPSVLNLQYISALKFLRFITYLTYCHRLSESCNISNMKSHVILTFFSYILYFHMLTCANMALIGFNKPLLERVYPGEDSHNYYVIWTQKHVRHPIDFKEGYLMLLRETTYLATFCYTNATLGDALPKWYLVAVWCTSKLVFTYFIASLMETLMTYRSSTRKYFEMVRELREYMIHKQLPMSLQQRLLTYYEFKFQKSYFRESDILNTISGQLKQDLLMHSCRRLVEHVEFFQNLPIALIIRIVSALSSEIYLVNDVIIKANTTGNCMYFIASGCVAVYTKSGYEVKHLVDGEYFGEYSLLKHCQPRESSCVAVEICELYRLGYRDFVKAILPYPDLLEKITKHALDRIEMTEYLEARATGARRHIYNS